MKRSDLPPELQSALSLYFNERNSSYRPEAAEALKKIAPELIPTSALRRSEKTRQRFLAFVKKNKRLPGWKDPRDIHVMWTCHHQAVSDFAIDFLRNNPQYIKVYRYKKEWYSYEEDARWIEDGLRRRVPDWVPHGPFWRATLYLDEWGPWRNKLIDRYKLKEKRWVSPSVKRSASR